MLPDNAEWQSHTQAFQEKSHTYFFQSSLATTWHLPFYSSAPHRSCESAQTKLYFISRHSSPRKKFWEMEVASKIMNHRGWMWNNSHETPPKESCWNFKVAAFAFVLQGKRKTFPGFIRLHLKSQKELKRAGNAEGKGIREQRAVKGIWQGNQVIYPKRHSGLPSVCLCFTTTEVFSIWNASEEGASGGGLPFAWQSQQPCGSDSSCLHGKD